MARERIQWAVVVDRARAIVEGYEGGVTPRQVMYRLTSEGVLPHTPSMHRHLSSHLAQARREGRFPDLIDILREVHVPPAWPDAGAFLRGSDRLGSAWTARPASSTPYTSPLRRTPSASWRSS
ncbi:hypothetical protein NRF20_43295 [Streptomyces sp. R-74717]|uniref:hypothetical protein n=1 Tax=Streptomyces TaxID=1883 RepID=UPI0037BE021B